MHIKDAHRSLRTDHEMAHIKVLLEDLCPWSEAQNLARWLMCFLISSARKAPPFTECVLRTHVVQVALSDSLHYPQKNIPVEL